MASDSGLRPTDKVRVSKTLSYILRHNAEKEGFSLLPGGYLYVDDILRKKKFHTVVLFEDIQAIVETNDKKRFTMVLEEETQRWKIRANQGHSIQVQDLDLRPVENSEEFPIIVHGTYHKYWKFIAQEGLKRMHRNHIHFAAGLPGEDGVISGMRSSCQIIIYLDLKKALEGGLKFFVSANNVILSPGNELGVIETQFFTKAVDRSTGRKLAYVGAEVFSETGSATSRHDIEEYPAAEPTNMTVTAEDIDEEFTKKPRKKKKNKHRADS